MLGLVAKRFFHVQLLEYSSCKNCTATLIARTSCLARFVKVRCHSYAFMTRYCKLLYGMVNAYTRGAVEVLYTGAVEVQLVVPSRYARGVVEVRLWCGRGTLVVRSRYARGAVEVRSWYGQGTLMVRSSGRGTLVVRSWYARGALPVHFRFGAVR